LLRLLSSTLARIGIVFRRSTTLATWASAFAKPALSMLSRMMDRYPNWRLLPGALGLAEAFQASVRPGKA
jgi:hypothetical protein